MSETLTQILNVCHRHAARLQWAMTQMQPLMPFTEQTLVQLHDGEIAILDSFASRFGKLQDAMGALYFLSSWNSPKNKVN
jgi:hypothetical protein